jgi:hypothetical protein
VLGQHAGDEGLADAALLATDEMNLTHGLLRLIGRGS